MGFPHKSWLYNTPAQPITETLWWLDLPFGDENIEDLFFPRDYSYALQEHTTENVLNQFLSSTTCIDFPRSFSQLDQIFGDEFQENMALSTFMETPCVFAIEEHVGSYTMPCEVSPGKVLHINAGLTKSQQEQLLKVLKIQSRAFAWEYTIVKRIHTGTCVHHIYMDANVSPIRQPIRGNFTSKWAS